MTANALAAVDAIDWNAVWADRLRRRYHAGAQTCDKMWATRDSARRYWNMATADPRYVARTMGGIAVGKSFSLLDIGAGPGNIAIPLAAKVARITAVEPAAGMADVLEKNCRQRAITNIACIRKKWEDIDPALDLNGPYDVVLAAFSLGMEDLAGAIAKMVRVARRRVYLFWFAGATDWEALYKDLWPKLHGRAYCPGPKADVLFNLCHQMGIYPNVTVFPYRSALRFASLNEALKEYRQRLRVSGLRADKALREMIEHRMIREGKSLVLHHTWTCVKFWWEIKKAEG
jgi:SAM-dependent methyltransferase